MPERGSGMNWERIQTLIYRTALNLVAISLSITFCLAASATAEKTPSWAEHFDLLNIIVGFLFVSLVALIVWLIKKIDNNQTEIFNRLNGLSKDFYIMEGEHRATMKLGGHTQRHLDMEGGGKE